MNNYPMGFQSLRIDRQLEECKKHFEKICIYKIFRTITESNEICLTVKKDLAEEIIFESDSKYAGIFQDKQKRNFSGRRTIRCCGYDDSELEWMNTSSRSGLSLPGS